MNLSMCNSHNFGKYIVSLRVATFETNIFVAYIKMIPHSEITSQNSENPLNNSRSFFVAFEFSPVLRKLDKAELSWVFLHQNSKTFRECLKYFKESDSVHDSSLGPLD